MRKDFYDGVFLLALGITVVIAANQGTVGIIFAIATVGFFALSKNNL